ncbi:TPA: hypothetical protein ACIYQC_005866, partial [Escherichia coli]
QCYSLNCPHNIIKSDIARSDRYPSVFFITHQLTGSGYCPSVNWFCAVQDAVTGSGLIRGYVYDVVIM